jgi:hypothetical protein
LDPRAQVLFNHRVPDRDTGRLRQVDVWIKARFLGHHISVLVSCKNHARKLDVSTIESFNAEVRSTSAHMGVIYSSSAFTSGALDKAKAYGVSCCRFYRDEPADIPAALILRMFLCASTMRITALETRGLSATTTWRQVLDLSVQTFQGPMTLIDAIFSCYHHDERAATDAVRQTRAFPCPWRNEYDFVFSDNAAATIRIAIEGRWRKYAGRAEAHLLSGSYCFSDSSFVGSQFGPSIDMQGPQPGPGWELIADEPDSPLPPCVVIMLRGGECADPLRKLLADRPLMAPWT